MNTLPLTYDNPHKDTGEKQRNEKIAAAIAAAIAITLGAVLGPNLHPNDTCANPDRKDAASVDQSAPEGVTKSGNEAAEPGSTITLCDDQPLFNQYGEDLNTTVHVYGGGCKTGLLKNPGGSFTVAAEDGKLSCTRTDSLPGFTMIDGNKMDLSGISCVRNSHGDAQTGIKPPKNPLD